MIEHPQILFGAIIGGVALLVAWLFWELPKWSRPGIFFAVTVMPSFRASDEARRILHGYRARAMAHLAIAFALIAVGALSGQALVLILGALWLIAGPMTAISHGHKQTLPHAMPTPTIHEVLRTASLTPRRGHVPGGWLLQIGPFALLFMAALNLRMRWDQIPERFPVHWGANGQPNGWATRTPIGVYGPLMFAAALIALISLLAYGISHGAKILLARDGVSAEDHANHIATAMVGIEFFIASVFFFVAMIPLSGSPGVLSIVIAVIPAIAIVLLVWSLRHIHENSHVTDGTPDSSWKLGLFYYNPQDSALFVEKRIGIGYTVNFARPMAWVMVGLTLALPLTLGALATWRR